MTCHILLAAAQGPCQILLMMVQRTINYCLADLGAPPGGPWAEVVGPTWVRSWTDLGLRMMIAQRGGQLTYTD